jgi:hypothetical protein
MDRHDSLNLFRSSPRPVNAAGASGSWISPMAAKIVERTALSQAGLHGMERGIPSFAFCFHLPIDP